MLRRLCLVTLKLIYLSFWRLTTCHVAQLCFSIAYIFSQFDESLSIFILKETPIHAHITISLLHSNAQFSISSSLLSYPTTSIQPPLEHRNRVRGIRRPRLRHVPMLNKTCAIHPVNICQGNGFLVHLIDTHVDEADVIIEAMTQNYRGNKRDDCQENPKSAISAAFEKASCPNRDDEKAAIFLFGHAESSRKNDAESSLTIHQLLLVRNPPLRIKRIMLGQVERDVLVESANDVFFDVELIDEAVEDLALDGFGRRVARAVAGVGAAFGEDAGVEAWCFWGSESE